MIETLLGGLLGGAFRLAPEILKWMDRKSERGHELAMQDKALEFEKNRAPEPTRGLSPREIDALTFLAMGYARGQVADMLSISEHTLRAYIESARFKLGAMNTTHAVARAMVEGLIIVGGSARKAEGDWPGRDQSLRRMSQAGAEPQLR